MGLTNDTQDKTPVVVIQMEDPTFEAGSIHSAVATITNNAGVQLQYTMELYLGVSKVATSGQVQATIPANGQLPVQFIVTMPAIPGTYQVYLDVFYQGSLLVHGQATEPVIIAVTPSVTIGDITWG